MSAAIDKSISLQKLNSTTLEKEFEWLKNLLEIKIKIYFKGECPEEISIPDLSNDNSNYAQAVRYYQMGLSERILILLALAPELRPGLLDVFFLKGPEGRAFTAFGGKGPNANKFIPTVETFLFLFAGDDISKRLKAEVFFDVDYYLRSANILSFHPEGEGTFLDTELRLSREFFVTITSGKKFRPNFSSSFPASLLTTRMSWEDLVIESDVLEEISEINAWIKYGDALLNEYGMGKIVKRGYRTLFYGPPGTGKTLTATLLGNSNNLDVYRIDLSMVVSKYIGETEKNLSNVFDQAENKKWILFFDEADALFGKRTQTKDAKDRYANQEISYLLQRIEDFPGVVILATNLKANMDDAFARRFQSMIYFPIPGPDLRYKLWTKAFSDKFDLDSDVNLKDIAIAYELAGGSIINVVRYCALMALNRNNNIITKEDLIHGIRKEFRKEGKTA